MKFALVFVVASVMVACSLAAPAEDQLDQAVVADVAESSDASPDSEPSAARVKRGASKHKKGRMLYDVQPVLPAYASPYSPYASPYASPYGAPVYVGK